MSDRRTTKPRLAASLLIAAALLAAAGLSMAALAGAENQPTVRQAGYGEPTCDTPSQTLDTRITKAPNKKTEKRKAKFTFEAFYCNFPNDDPADPEFIDFECTLDGDKKSCSSPQRYSGLKKGKHKFGVSSAFDSSTSGGDPSPDKHRWKILD